MAPEAWALILTGLVVGVVSGLLGIGGAVMLVPALVFIFKFSQPQAQGTSLGALVPPIGIFAALQYWRNGFLDVRTAALIAVGFVAGAFLGALLVPRIPEVWLKRVFATLMFYIAAQLAFAGDERRGILQPGVLAAAGAWLLIGSRRIVAALRRFWHRTGGPPKPRSRRPGDVYHI
jgi:uncharacterized membrane protein YfcA